MRTKLGGLLLLVGACTGSSHSEVEQKVADPAPTLSITATSFHSAIGGLNITYCGQLRSPLCLSAPPVQVRCGTPLDGCSMRGLGFDAGPPHTISYGASCPIGTLTHFNFPTVSGPWASGASLALSLRVDPCALGAPLFDQTMTIPFTI